MGWPSDALSPPGTTLARQHHPCHRGGGVQLSEVERRRAGFYGGASPCPFGGAIPSVFGVAHSPQLSPSACPASLLPEQLSSLACKGNETAAPVCFGCKPRDHGAVQKTHRSPCVSGPRREAEGCNNFLMGRPRWPAIPRQEGDALLPFAFGAAAGRGRAEAAEETLSHRSQGAACKLFRAARGGSYLAPVNLRVNL